ncbi:MAG: hypothetical protein NVSMB47_03690 [Polyangiales bacterium]
MRDSPRDKSGRRRKVEVATGDAAAQSFVASFGEGMRRLRLAHGWTQAELAGKAALSPNYVARLERGELGPSLFVAHRIAVALGVELDALISAAAPAPALGRTKRRAG